MSNFIISHNSQEPKDFTQLKEELQTCSVFSNLTFANLKIL